MVVIGLRCDEAFIRKVDEYRRDEVDLPSRPEALRRLVTIGRSNTLHKTYAPVDIEAVRNTDTARLKGRRRMRAENESGAKVSKK